MKQLPRLEHSGAIDMFDLALRGKEVSGVLRAAAWTRLLKASAQEDLGDTAGARQSLDDAARTFRHLGDTVSEATTLGVLGDFSARAGMSAAAESLYHRALRLIEDHHAAPARLQRLPGHGARPIGSGLQHATHLFRVCSQGGPPGKMISPL